MANRCALITGTTSGIGRALTERLLADGWRVVAVNRRAEAARRTGVRWIVVDLADTAAVHAALAGLSGTEWEPAVLFLQAGINRPDNTAGLDAETFQTVVRTNLFGVTSFLGAMRQLKWSEKKVVALSSTSNIVPNPGHAGYFVSKLALHELFKLVRRNDPANDFRSVILGPVHTNICAGYEGPSGFQKKIFDRLAKTPEQTAGALVRFVETPRRTLSYPLRAIGFYVLVRALLWIAPGLYSGTVSKPVEGDLSHAREQA